MSKNDSDCFALDDYEKKYCESPSADCIDHSFVAMIAHNVNKAYCHSIGDDSQPNWHEAPQWQKDSAINGVKYHLSNDNVTPEQSHESWLKQKQDEGWKYGEVKDPEKKEHPCFRPYSELPQEQRTKDFLFKAVVDSFKF
ncbi:RyR domain-containing protein [Entomomonas asaccharolytica]|uniref:Ryanodine receptor Ryr domain-containing protein n=1 Tax=Entomomonas asaccharolytica TaxID=2785331 RepID=A0A974NHL0_9GAMM|nr:RyR domain-containing protein [Entomomonas asaccharolytica]QQP86906.1 hypothetical protein JHT90_06590 [Entomomonas asaccharolytica]